MKAAILIFALIASQAFAQDRLVMANEGGGEIVLTDRVCVVSGTTYERLREAYAYNSTGQMMTGCWVLRDGLIHAVWAGSNGAVKRVYKPQDFEQRWSQ